MLIAIDASRANKKDKTGVEWYSYYVIEEMKKITPDNVRVVLYTNDKLSDGLQKMPSGWQEKRLNWPPKYLWTQIRLWWELMMNPPDVLFVPAHTIPFLPFSRKIKVVVTVHDVGFKRYPDLYKKIQYWYHHLSMLKIRRRADVILTVSEFSKQEIVDLYGVKPDKIQVVYLGDSSSELDDEGSDGVLKKYNVSKPFLFFVGRIEKKKNVLGIIEAFILVRAKYPNLQLVLAGSAGNEFVRAQEIVSSLGLEGDIILPGYVSFGEVAILMSQAEIFLFTTLYEGFGLPPLQAMKVKTPVVTSDQNPHREVAGDSALYADPSSPSEIANRINDILSDDDLKQRLIASGLSRVNLFSWSKTSQEILKILMD